MAAMAKAVAAWLAQGDDRGGDLPRAPRRVDRGEDVIVGVNKYRLAEEAADRHPRCRQSRGARRPGRADRAGEARATRRGVRGASARARTRFAKATRDGDAQPARARRRMRPGRARRSARSRRRWRTCSGATARTPTPVSGDLWRCLRGRCRAGPRPSEGVAATERRLGRKPRHARRQDGPGRARPRRQPGRRQHVRRSRLRRRSRARCSRRPTKAARLAIDERRRRGRRLEPRGGRTRR